MDMIRSVVELCSCVKRHAYCWERLSRACHLEAVQSAIESLERARGAVEQQMEHEFVALDLREGLDALGEIVGHVSTEDLLGRIFSEFCVGK